MKTKDLRKAIYLYFSTKKDDPKGEYYDIILSPSQFFYRFINLRELFNFVVSENIGFIESNVKHQNLLKKEVIDLIYMGLGL